jgi:hypothetical protein
VRINAEYGLVAFLDTVGIWHGYYHPDEYFGVGEELVRKYVATYDWQIGEEIYRKTQGRSRRKLSFKESANSGPLLGYG